MVSNLNLSRFWPVYLAILHKVLSHYVSRESIFITIATVGLIVILRPDAVINLSKEANLPAIVVFHTSLQVIHILVLVPAALIYASRKGFPSLPFFFLISVFGFFVSDGLWKASFGYSDEFTRSSTGILAIAVLVTIAVTISALFVEKAICEILVEHGLSPVAIFPKWRAVEDDTDLQSQLPVGKRAQIIRIEAQRDHVVVHTVEGLHMLRMSLKEAASKIRNDAGLIVHRSHWVRKSHMTSLKYESGNPRLTLRGGTVVPVSRSAAPSVKAALALQPEGPE